MLKIYHSRKAALRFARSAFGEQWAQNARYLEIALPDGEMLYCIQPRERAAPSRASKPSAARHSPATKAIKANDGIIRRCRAIFELMPDLPRRELLAECVRQGAALSTAATQYQRWKKERGSASG